MIHQQPAGSIPPAPQTVAAAPAMEANAIVWIRHFGFSGLVDPGGIGYALSAAGLFGAGTPAAKLLLQDLSPLALSALLYVGAAAALSAYRLVRPSDSREAGITRRDLPLVAGIVFFGGIAGPVLMLFGLQRVSALSASLLLNLENPFTLIIAVTLMREHLGRRETFAAAAIMLGGALITLEPGHLGGSLAGAVEISAACLSWAIDNNLTQRISLRDPVAVARVKTAAAGTCLTVIALAQGDGSIPPGRALIWALVVGGFCYGASIVFDVKALRLLGAARESAFFATAPFVGAVLSIAIFRDVPSVAEILGAALMVLGVVAIVWEKHAHRHAHEAVFHDHVHRHDEHHQHEHRGAVTEPHSHPHLHPPLTHEHPHVSDVHHRHSHRIV